MLFFLHWKRGVKLVPHIGWKDNLLSIRHPRACNQSIEFLCIVSFLCKNLANRKSSTLILTSFHMTLTYTSFDIGILPLPF